MNKNCPAKYGMTIFKTEGQPARQAVLLFS